MIKASSEPSASSGTWDSLCPLFRKGHRGSWGQMACPRSLCYNFIQKWVSLHFEFHQMKFFGDFFKAVLNLLVLDLQDDNLAAFIPSPLLEK